MQYKALPWLRVCTFGLGAQSVNIWIRDWNVRNAIIEVLVLRNPRTLSDPPGLNRNKSVITWPLGRLADLSHSGASRPRVINQPAPSLPCYN